MSGGILLWLKYVAGEGGVGRRVYGAAILIWRNLSN